jgi:hypothetical protein
MGIKYFNVASYCVVFLAVLFSVKTSSDTLCYISTTFLPFGRYEVYTFSVDCTAHFLTLASVYNECFVLSILYSGVKCNLIKIELL